MIAQNSKVKSQNCSSKLKTDLRGRCYNFSISVVKFIEKLPQKRTFWIISDQVLRSATSIGANVVEVKSSSSKIEALLKECEEISKMLAKSLLTLKDKRF